MVAVSAPPTPPARLHATVKVTTTSLLASVVATVVLTSSTAVATAAPRPASDVQLQRAVDHVVDLGIPGAIALIRTESGTTRIAGGYGDIARKAPIRTTDRFRIGSLTKTFVSTLALQLADEGTISLDDSVEHWLPGLVPNGRRITVRQLLNMRAGLYDYLNQDKTIVNRYIAGDLTHRYTPHELVGLSTKHKPNFAPGASYAYCNTCYVLIGLIVEKATRHTLAAELQRRIFGPLHLRDTTFDSEPHIAGAHAHGYVWLGKRRLDVSVASPTPAGAAGAIVSTVADLDRFFGALNGGRLLPPPLLRAMTTATPASHGYGLGYARVQTPHCGTLWWNNGNYLGYNASAFGSPGGGRQLILFVNLDESNLTAARMRALNQVLFTALCGGSP
jgi:D-alanyl-D-alanine carboxypeptidase